MSNTIGPTGVPPAGLIRFYCNYCKRAVADTLPRAQVQCPKGHKCVILPSAPTSEAIRKNLKK